MANELTVMKSQDLALAELEFPIDRLVAQKAAIQRAMSAVMKDGEHYGVIPGTEKKDKNGKDISKPSLLQPGADTLSFLFRLEPEYITAESVMRDDLISYDIRCILRHIDTGRKWGEGMGSCNSREKRYQASASAKVCPQCNKPTIIKGKAEYGGGWICFEKKGGCKAKFRDGDKAIEEQEGQVQTTGVWDLKNTILKMACKRARVAAVLAATAASDCFTQDLEDLVEYLPPAPKNDTNPPADAGKGIMGLATPPEPDVSTLPEEYTENVPCYDPKTGDIIKRAPGITSAQSKHIHALLGKLGHHMDETKRGKDGKGGEILHLGKYRKKLREIYGKEHTSELAIHEASWVIEWLLKCEAKMERAMDRGNEGLPTPAPVTPTSEDMGPLLDLASQLVANGHKTTDAQLGWVNNALEELGHPRVLSPSALTAGQLDVLLERARGEVR